MLDQEEIQKKVDAFKVKYGVQDQDEHIIATLHVINKHRIDLAAAQDQTSHGAGDHGIDGWYFDKTNATLSIYQSKLSGSRPHVLKGFEGLTNAADWIAGLLATGQIESPLTNPAIHNLARCLDANREKIRRIHFFLVSPFDENEIEDCSEFEDCRRFLVKSSLNTYISSRRGEIDIRPEQYCLDKAGLPSDLKSYEARGFAESTVVLTQKTRLEIVFLYLSSLVELFRIRGNRLFEKNIRLYLNTKEARTRLEHPLENTLEKMCSGELDPKLFPFYHVGVTLTAGSCAPVPERGFSLETPFVINGCQTINIADRFLRHLEKEKERAAAKIEKFRKIPVLAKIVIGATDEQVREIANCNNRQNPIESWQLFSNDPVHVEIEMALASVGVFYERQKGKFDADMRFTDTLNRYFNTNGTKITVMELGQIICLCRRQLQLSAKPSDIFASKQVHDQSFDRTIQDQVHDIIWSFNAFKATKAALRTYLQLPAHDNESSHRIFVKPLVKQSLYYVAMMHLYQRCQDLAPSYARRLNKKAPSVLGDQADVLYRKVISKTKVWYLEESKNLAVEVSWRKLDSFLTQLCHEGGLDSDGPMPFTGKPIDWEALIPREQDEGEG